MPDPTISRELSKRIGRIGAYSFQFDALPMAEMRPAVAAIEALGYGAIWVPEFLA